MGAGAEPSAAAAVDSGAASSIKTFQGPVPKCPWNILKVSFPCEALLLSPELVLSLLGYGVMDLVSSSFFFCLGQLCW